LVDQVGVAQDRVAQGQFRDSDEAEVDVGQGLRAEPDPDERVARDRQRADEFDDVDVELVDRGLVAVACADEQVAGVPERTAQGEIVDEGFVDGEVQGGDLPSLDFALGVSSVVDAAQRELARGQRPGASRPGLDAGFVSRQRERQRRARQQRPQQGQRRAERAPVLLPRRCWWRGLRRRGDRWRPRWRFGRRCRRGRRGPVVRRDRETEMPEMISGRKTLWRSPKVRILASIS
jgi:hypothetical protein